MENNNWKEISNQIDTIVKEHYQSDELWMDGIIDAQKYGKAKYRILWILKEPYDDGYDGRQNILDKKELKDFGASISTFRPIIYTSWSILNDFKILDEASDINVEMLEALKSIAFINISKVAGTTSSPEGRISDAYAKNKESLLKQIDAYKPNIIIGGGTLHHFLTDLGIADAFMSINDENAFGIAKYCYKNNIVYIAAPHPAQRKIAKRLYADDIIIIAEKYLSKKPRIKSLELLKGQLNDAALEFKMELKFHLALGCSDSFFSFSKPQWQDKNIAIGFGFDNSLGNFFYGICKKSLDQNFSTEAIEKIKNDLKSDDMPTENWPFWKWHERRQWDKEVFNEIENGILIDDIKAKVRNLTDKLEAIF